MNKPLRWIAAISIVSCFSAEVQASTIPVTTTSQEARREYEEGRRLLDTWRLDDARPHFEKAVELDPDFVLGWFGLSFSQPQFKDMFELADHALALLDRVEVSPGEAMIIRRYHASINSDPAGWEHWARRLADAYPEDPRAQQELGDFVAFFQNDRLEGLKLYRRSLQLAPHFLVGWVRLSAAHLLLGHPAEAEAGFRRAIALAPDDPTLRQFLADFLVEEGRMEESQTSYRAALALDPLHEGAHQGLASALILRNQHDEARAHLEDLYERAPHDGYRSGLHFALAVTYADQHRWNDALRELERNLALSEKNGDSFAAAVDLANIARVQLQAGLTGEALASREKLLAVIVEDPEQPEKRKDFHRAQHLFWKGRIALAQGGLESARSLAQRYTQRAQELDHPRLLKLTHQIAAEIALVEERWTDAIKELYGANPETAGNMYRIAKAHLALGEHDSYRRMLSYVVEYRGILNLDYAFVRQDAEAEWADTGEDKSAPAGE